MPAELAGHRVLVAGLGVSGRAAVQALTPHDVDITTLDHAAPEADLHDAGDVDLTATDLIVVSPGWAPNTPVLADASRRGVPVWSEVELAWRLRAQRPDATGPAPWLAVTGTNGKTTAVGMLAAILRAAGLDAPAVGNVGEPVVTAATDPSHDVLAVELSSFQLHFTHTMSAQAAAVLNIAPDHLDWHGSLESYAADKARIYSHAQVACVYDVTDSRLEDMVRAADVAPGARAVGISTGTPAPGDLGLVEDLLVDRSFHLPADDPTRATHSAELGTLADLHHLAGPDGRLAQHVILDALAAAALARAHGVPASAVRDGLRAFRPAAHRTHLVAEVNQVAYVDDSKATNAHAAAASLAAYAPGTVIWIAGGLAKGADLGELVRQRGDRLRATVVIGVDPGPIRDAMSRHAPTIPVEVIDPADTDTVMSRAVTAARRLARPGDTVLLAPACASMDQFTSYAHRGEAFVAAVHHPGS